MSISSDREAQVWLDGIPIFRGVHFEIARGMINCGRKGKGGYAHPISCGICLFLCARLYRSLSRNMV